MDCVGKFSKASTNRCTSCAESHCRLLLRSTKLFAISVYVLSRCGFPQEMLSDLSLGYNGPKSRNCGSHVGKNKRCGCSHSLPQTLERPVVQMIHRDVSDLVLSQRVEKALVTPCSLRQNVATDGLINERANCRCPPLQIHELPQSVVHHLVTKRRWIAMKSSATHLRPLLALFFARLVH